jgi:hypothetical protein
MNDPSGGMTSQVAPTSNGMAIAGMVLAICAVVVSWLPGVNFVCWLLGLIFSIVGLRNANRGAPYRGMAIAGLVISLVGIVSIIILVVIIGIGAALSA